MVKEIPTRMSLFMRVRVSAAEVIEFRILQLVTSNTPCLSHCDPPPPTRHPDTWDTVSNCPVCENLSHREPMTTKES